MRNLALITVLGSAALAAPARADRKDIVAPTARVAAAGSTPRTDRAALTGEHGITGRAPRGDAFLEAREVAAEVRPYAPEIERCYLDRLDDVHRAGRLDLTLVIGRDGHLVSLHTAAPGLPARTVERVAACIREAVEVVHFPERRNDTTAIVPYFFQYTSTPGGGPQLSCWDPKGCHAR